MNTPRDRVKDRHLVLEGMQFRLDGQDFDPTCDFVYCRICGAAYQTKLCRIATKMPYTDEQFAAYYQAQEARRSWSFSHASIKHTVAEQEALEASGLFMTPEAQLRLAPLGVIALTDFKKSEGHHQAGLEAPRYSEEYA